MLLKNELILNQTAYIFVSANQQWAPAAAPDARHMQPTVFRESQIPFPKITS